jgi:hypothetical protein
MSRLLVGVNRGCLRFIRDSREAGDLVASGLLPINLTVARETRARVKVAARRFLSPAHFHPSFRPISAALTCKCLHDTPNASFLILELTRETTCSTEKKIANNWSKKGLVNTQKCLSSGTRARAALARRAHYTLEAERQRRSMRAHYGLRKQQHRMSALKQHGSLTRSTRTRASSGSKQGRSAQDGW